MTSAQELKLKIENLLTELGKSISEDKNSLDRDDTFEVRKRIKQNIQRIKDKLEAAQKELDEE